MNKPVSFEIANLKIGDRVVLIKKTSSSILNIGDEGIICDISNNSLSVNFERDIQGHSCSGKCINGFGWYVDITAIRKKYYLKISKEELLSDKYVIYLDSKEEWEKINSILGFKITTEFKGRYCYSPNELNYSSSSSKTTLGSYSNKIIITIKDVLFDCDSIEAQQKSNITPVVGKWYVANCESNIAYSTRESYLMKYSGSRNVNSHCSDEWVVIVNIPQKPCTSGTFNNIVREATEEELIKNVNSKYLNINLINNFYDDKNRKLKTYTIGNWYTNPMYTLHVFNRNDRTTFTLDSGPKYFRVKEAKVCGTRGTYYTSFIFDAVISEKGILYENIYVTQSNTDYEYLMREVSDYEVGATTIKYNKVYIHEIFKQENKNNIIKSINKDEKSINIIKSSKLVKIPTSITQDRVKIVNSKQLIKI